MTTRPLKFISLSLAAVYLALVSLATFCVSFHAIHHSPIAHHSKSQVSHSSLCSLACQVSSKGNSADPMQGSLFVLSVFFIGIVLRFSVTPTEAVLSQTPARGPPV